MQIYWPIALLVISNVFYHLCSKSVPERLNPFAALTVTYLIGAAVSAAAFFVQDRGQSLLGAYRQLNWTPFVLGLAIVGLEVGSIYMYKVGWSLGTGQFVQSAILEVCLILIGIFAYREALTPTKLLGVAVCLLGLFLINK